MASSGKPYRNIRKRWLVLPNWGKLHRVAETEGEDWEADGLIPIGIQGVTLCGLVGRLAMPGVFSRMGLPRCAHCCDRLGIPRGDGAAYNDKTLSQRDRAR